MLKKAFFLVFFSFFLTNCKEVVRKEADGFVSHEHGKIYYKIYGSGKPIIVLHGGPELNQTYLKPHLLPLAKSHKLIFIDQRGGGRSTLDKIDETTVSMAHFTKDIEQVRQHLALDKITIMGHSWGGLVAMNYAANYQDKVDSLLLIASAPADYIHQKQFIDDLIAKIKPVINKFNTINKNNSKLDPNELTEAYRKLNKLAYFYNTDKVDELNIGINFNSFSDALAVKEIIANQEFLQKGTKLPKKLAGLKIPTLLIHGRQDTVPVSASMLIAEIINTNNGKAKLIEFDECGHYPFIEQKEKFLLELERFMLNF